MHWFALFWVLQSNIILHICSQLNERNLPRISKWYNIPIMQISTNCDRIFNLRYLWLSKLSISLFPSIPFFSPLYNIILSIRKNLISLTHLPFNVDAFLSFFLFFRFRIWMREGKKKASKMSILLTLIEILVILLHIQKKIVVSSHTKERER